MKLTIALLISLMTLALAMVHWQLALFGIPFFVLIAYTIYQFVMYEKEMKEWIGDSDFTLECRDGDVYVVPRSKK